MRPGRPLLPAEHPPLFLLPLLLAAALAGNCLPFQLMLNFQVIFGSVFAFVALELFGLPAACAIGAVASACTYFLWHQPYSIAVMTLEVLAVGWLRRGRGADLLIADTLFWIVLGAPLNWALHGLVAHRAPEIVHMIVAKQAVNGILNALLARLIVTGLAFSNVAGIARHIERIRLHDLIFLTLATFVLVPSLTLVGIDGRSEEARTRDDSRRKLLALARQTRGTLDRWLADHLEVVRTLALEASPSAATPDLQARLDDMRAVDADFLRVAVMNREAVAVAYSPAADAAGKRAVGQNVAGSAFARSLRWSMRPGISDLMMAKIGPRVPIVVAGAPIVRDGRYAGYAAAALNAEALAAVIRGLTAESGLHATLLDRQGRVIASSRDDIRVMDTLPWKRAGMIRDTDGVLLQWLPPATGGISLVEQLRRSFHFIEGPMQTARSWRLVVESPMDAYVTTLNDRYSKTLGVLFAVFVAALAAARLASRKAAASIRDLGETTAGLPGRISRREPIAWPKTPVAETEALIDNFRSTADTLSLKFEDLRVMNDTLERRVAERTASVELANEELRREISERRTIQARLASSEASYRLLAENATDVIARVSPQGVALYVSPAAATLLAYSPRELVGRDITELVHDEDIAAVRRARDEIMRSEGAVRLTSRVRRGDGAWVWTEAAARAVVDPATGRAQEIVLVVRDVSDRKRAEEENARLVAQMLHAQKLESLGLLAGGIAHDFNNLLTCVLGNAELGHAGLPPDSPVHDRLAQIETAARRAAEMAGQMLAYSGQGRLTVRRMDISATVREMASLLRSSIRKTSVLDLRLADGIPAIEADASQLQQVVLNLITNAAEAIAGQPGTITLRTARVEADRTLLDRFQMAENLPEGSYVGLDVTDTGCGMTGETLSRMFDPYFTTKFTGRGLGLAAVLGIVRGHRGALRVVSAPGEGTSFTVLFPAAGPPAPAADPKRGYDVDRRALSGAVLVVDDEDSVREVAASMLRELGLSVVTARDGLEAVEAFRARPDSIRLVLLDVTMPRMGGEDAFREIRRIRGDVPVILSSGYALHAQQNRLAEIGASKFIQKPYAMAELADAVRASLCV